MKKMKRLTTKIKERMFCALLTLAMVVTLMPVGVFADTTPVTLPAESIHLTFQWGSEGSFLPFGTGGETKTALTNDMPFNIYNDEYFTLETNNDKVTAEFIEPETEWPYCNVKITVADSTPIGPYTITATSKEKEFTVDRKTYIITGSTSTTINVYDPEKVDDTHLKVNINDLKVNGVGSDGEKQKIRIGEKFKLSGLVTTEGGHDSVTDIGADTKNDIPYSFQVYLCSEENNEEATPLIDPLTPNGVMHVMTNGNFANQISGNGFTYLPDAVFRVPYADEAEYVGGKVIKPGNYNLIVQNLIVNESNIGYPYQIYKRSSASIPIEIIEPIMKDINFDNDPSIGKIGENWAKKTPNQIKEMLEKIDFEGHIYFNVTGGGNVTHDDYFNRGDEGAYTYYSHTLTAADGSELDPNQPLPPDTLINLTLVLKAKDGWTFSDGDNSGGTLTPHNVQGYTSGTVSSSVSGEGIYKTITFNNLKTTVVHKHDIKYSFDQATSTLTAVCDPPEDDRCTYVDSNKASTPDSHSWKAEFSLEVADLTYTATEQPKAAKIVGKQFVDDEKYQENVLSGDTEAARTRAKVSWSNKLSDIEYYMKKDGAFEKIEGWPKDAGTYKAKHVIKDGNSNTYTLESKEFKINPAKFYIEAGSAEKDYDGTPLTADFCQVYNENHDLYYYEISQLLTGYELDPETGEILFEMGIPKMHHEGIKLDSIKMTSDSTITKGGTVANKIDQTAIEFVEGTNPDNFELVFEDGTLTITGGPAVEPPEGGEGYILNYVDETLTAEDGFEISSTNGDTVTPLEDDKVEPGSTYYIRRVTEDGTSVWVEIQVKDRPDAPAKPELDSKTQTTITVKAVAGQEYSIDGGNTWIKSTGNTLEFNGLTKGTQYSIITRTPAITEPAGSEQFASNPSKALKVRTSSDIFDITLIHDDQENGYIEVQVDGMTVTQAKPGDKVKIISHPVKEDYILGSIRYNDDEYAGNGFKLLYDWENPDDYVLEFVMPECPVTLTDYYHSEKTGAINHHKFAYTVEGDKLIATCSCVDCTLENHQAKGYLKIDDKSYDGIANVATFDFTEIKSALGSTSDNLMKATFSYFKEGIDSNLASAPINAAKYIVKAKITSEFEDQLKGTIPNDFLVKNFEITKRPVTLVAGSDEKVFDNTPLTKNTFSIKDSEETNYGFVGDEGIESLSMTNDSTITNYGTKENKINRDSIVAKDGTNLENYNLTLESGTLKITKQKMEKPGDGVGYVIDYAEETLKALPGYEVSKEIGDTATPLEDDKVEPGSTYYVRAIPSDDNMDPSDWVEIHVKDRPDEPAKPEFDSKTDSTITVKAVAGQEYSIDGGKTWIKDADDGTADSKVVFTALAEATTYNIITRKCAVTTPGSEDFASKNSEPLQVTTKHNANTEFNITIANSVNGTVEAQIDGKKAEKAKEGQTVAVVPKAEEGYMLDTLVFNDGKEDHDIYDTGVETTTTRELTMPESDITIKATFRKETHNITFEENGNKVVATCRERDCTLPNKQVVLTLTAEDKYYDGKAYDKATTDAETTKFEEIANATIEEITYTDMSESTLDSAPKDAGTYIARVVVARKPVAFQGTKEKFVAKQQFTIKKRPVSIVAGNKQKEFDTTPLTCNDFTVKLSEEPNSGFVEGEGFTSVIMTDDSTQTAIGEHDNVIDEDRISEFGLKDGTKLSNYDFTFEHGKLKVVKPKGVAPNGDEKIIDYEKETMVVADEAFELSTTNGDEASPLTEDQIDAGGTYYIRRKETDETSPSEWVEIKIPPRREAPEKPELESTTKTEITIFAKDKQEYGIDTGDKNITWVRDDDKDGFITFEELTKETAYNIVTRFVAITTPAEEAAFASKISEPLLAKTKGDSDKYKITLGEMQNGTVKVRVNGELAREAFEGDVVEIAGIPEAGYEVDELIYDYGGRKHDISRDKMFNMPGRDVTVTATFKEMSDLTALVQFKIDCQELKLTAKEASNSKANLSWNSVKLAHGYEVYGINKNGEAVFLKEVAKNSAVVDKYPKYRVVLFVEFKGNILHGKYSADTDLIIKSPAPTPKAPKLAKGKISKLKSLKKRTMAITFKKITGATQYEIYYKNGKKAKTIKTTKTKLTIKKLKSKKKYAVKIRGIYQKGTLKSVGAWSPAKKVKIK